MVVAAEDAGRGGEPYLETGERVELIEVSR
jgi:hypothetical protein